MNLKKDFWIHICHFVIWVKRLKLDEQIKFRPLHRQLPGSLRCRDYEVDLKPDDWGPTHVWTPPPQKPQPPLLSHLFSDGPQLKSSLERYICYVMLLWSGTEHEPSWTFSRRFFMFSCTVTTVVVVGEKNPVDICRLLLNRFNQHDGKSLGFFTAKKLYWLQRQDELKTWKVQTLFCGHFTQT